MKLDPGGVLVALAALGLGGAFAARAQTAPQVVWSAPTPSLLANSIQGVDWAPGTAARVALGSTDRWVRTRQAGSGALVYSVLQPHRSGAADQALYSTDGAFLAVHNSSGGLGYRVHRAVDGVFLGTLMVTIDPNGIVRFAPDAQLVAATGGDGTLSRWRLANFTVVRVVGSGYDRVTTTFRISPDNTLQAGASQGSITLQRRSDGVVVRLLTGGATRGTTPMAFTPDSTRLAAWAANPNETTLWRIADGAVVMRFANATSQEGVVALRFSPGGTRLVTTGYQPFVDADGLWQQKGIIRFWRVADGARRHTYDARTGIGVTSPIAWSPDMARFAYGTYEGTALVAATPAP
jgi:WD40 repeat protein